MPETIKLVIVGDSHVGKTTLAITYACNRFPTEYIPITADFPDVQVTVDNHEVILGMWDGSMKGEDYDHLRPLMYPGADIILVCFSINDKKSFQNTTDYWYPELRHHIPAVPTILVGCKSDLRIPEDPAFISRQEANNLATELGCDYCETSSLLHEGLHGCMETAIRTAMLTPQKPQIPALWKDILCCRWSSVLN